MRRSLDWVVQYAIADAVAADVLAAEFVLVERQGKLARHAVAVENQRVFGQAGTAARAIQIIVEKALDALIRRAQVAGQQARFLAIAFQQVIGNGQKSRIIARQT